MALTAGIVGLPNVGKSTLFNAITNSKIEAANYPFATIEPNVGIVEVPDHRLLEITKLIEPKKTIPTTIEFTDIAGLVKGASTGEGLGNKFLSNIRETDAICQVVRCFEDDNIVHVDGKVDPVGDAGVINYELILSDLEQANKRFDKIKKKAETGDKESKVEYDILVKLIDAFNNELPGRSVELSKEDKEIIKHLNFLTIKPMIYVANVSEEDLIDINSNKHYTSLKELAQKEACEITYISAKIEEELVDLNPEEKKEFMSDLGIEESGLDRLIKSTYTLLDLKTYFTAGVQEVRAWTFKNGMSAPQCAGIIHTDFEKGFIRAEVMSYDDLITFKTELKVKEEGKLHSQGKDYIMQDGDICHFLFNN
ncbi:MAG: redox-regulated ATPase YchF [Mycoplasmatales bacterium]